MILLSKRDCLKKDVKLRLDSCVLDKKIASINFHFHGITPVNELLNDFFNGRSVIFLR